MYNEVKIVSLSGTIIIDDVVVADMLAQKISNTDINVNISIQSFPVYSMNKAKCDEYIETFKQHVQELE